MRFHNHSHLDAYQLYFAARTKLYSGKWLHVTFTPKGKDVSLDDMLSRVQSALAKEKSLDFALLIHEDQNTHHFHGFIHCSSTCKLSKLKKDDLITTLIAKSGPPEGWLGYCYKHKPDHYYTYNYNGLYRNTHKDTFDIFGKCVCSQNKIFINTIGY